MQVVYARSSLLLLWRTRIESLRANRLRAQGLASGMLASQVNKEHRAHVDDGLATVKEVDTWVPLWTSEIKSSSSSSSELVFDPFVLDVSAAMSHVRRWWAATS